MEEKAVKKRNRTPILIGIMVIFLVGVIISVWSPTPTENPTSDRNQFVPVTILDEPPFGLNLPDTVIDNEEDFERGMLEDVPETWEGQAYKIENDVNATLAFYEGLEGWDIPEYETFDQYGFNYHVLTYYTDEDVLMICVAYSDAVTYLGIMGFVE